MDRRRFLALAASTAVPASAPRTPSPRGPSIDTLVYDRPSADVPAAIKAGIGAVVLDLDIYPRGFQEAVEALAGWNWAFRKRGTPLVRVLRGADLKRAFAEKKLGIILACQDGQVLGPSTFSTGEANLARLALLYDLGLRVMQLTHNERNAVGAPHTDGTDTGLTAFGRRVVEEMATLRMLVDLSHCGGRTMIDAVNASKRPCVITHAACRALVDSTRNKTDDEIRMVASTGGVFGVFALNPWIKAKGAGTLEDVVAHVEHALQVAGIDHVAFGSDGRLLGEPDDHNRVAALNGPDRLARLCDALAKRGHKSATLDKLAGANIARVFTEVCG